MLHALLKSEGLVINRKRTYRIYSELGMQVRTKRRKKLVRPRVPMAVPTQVNERWSLDFVHDQLADGRRIRILNIVDDFSRKCVGQLVDTSISGVRLVRYLDELAQLGGYIDLRRAAGSLSRRACPVTTKAKIYCHGQRPRTDQQGHVLLVAKDRCQTLFHTTRQANAECGLSEPALVPFARRCQGNYS
jgi:transposase InsO family protein